MLLKLISVFIEYFFVVVIVMITFPTKIKKKDRNNDNDNKPGIGNNEWITRKKTELKRNSFFSGKKQSKK